MSGIATWTPELIAKLRDLWEQKTPQLSTAAIGDRLGVSKNAAIAKAHRIHLSERPSPIRRSGLPSAPAPQRLPPLQGSTLPALTSADTDPCSRHLESAAPPTWTVWCDQLPHNAFNAIRRAQHKADCPVTAQRMSLRLWECTCGASQPGSEVVAEPVKR